MGHQNQQKTSYSSRKKTRRGYGNCGLPAMLREQNAWMHSSSRLITTPPHAPILPPTAHLACPPTSARVCFRCAKHFRKSWTTTAAVPTSPKPKHPTACTAGSEKSSLENCTDR